VSKLDAIPPTVDSILLVDDEPDILDALKDLFEVTMPDTEVLTASNGEEALKILRARSVGVIISDFKMPGMDGLELLMHAKQLHPDTPRILITAYPQVNLAMGAINDAAIQNFFTKPLNPVQVQDAVKAALLKARQEAIRRRNVQSRLQSPPRHPLS
jgi:adenylate cyclase